MHLHARLGSDGTLQECTYAEQYEYEPVHVCVCVGPRVRECVNYTCIRERENRGRSLLSQCSLCRRPLNKSITVVPFRCSSILHQNTNTMLYRLFIACVTRFRNTFRVRAMRTTVTRYHTRSDFSTTLQFMDLLLFAGVHTSICILHTI